MCHDTRVCDCACMRVYLSLSLSCSLSLSLFLSVSLCAIARVHVCVCAYARRPQKSPITLQQELCTSAKETSTSDISISAKRYLPKSPFSQHKITTHVQKKEKHFWRTEKRKHPDTPARRALHVRQKISIHLQKRQKHFWHANKCKNPYISAKRALHVCRRERQLWCMDIRKRYPQKRPLNPQKSPIYQPKDRITSGIWITGKEPYIPAKEPYVSAKDREAARTHREWCLDFRDESCTPARERGAPFFLQKSPIKEIIFSKRDL